MKIPKVLTQTIKPGDSVVTRFPPEPSGYLHLGHYKAIRLNEHLAREHDGRMLLRFDDTNPSKEKGEYQEAIQQDLKSLGVVPDGVSHTSDYFDELLARADELVARGLAYVDFSSSEEIAEQRQKGLPSPAREQTVEQNQGYWAEMKAGKPGGLLRLRFQPDHKNKNMRDPYAYRIVDLPHHRTGSRYSVYPSYDFSCPLVDHFEGVTHVMRGSQYADRAEQYKAVLKLFKLPVPVLYCYGEVNFTGVEMSKRKIKAMVEEGKVLNFADPRLPTIQGVLARGMSVAGLQAFVDGLGYSKSPVNMEWDKIWATNRKIVDKIATRVVGLSQPAPIEVVMGDGDELVEKEEIPRMARNAELGTRPLTHSLKIWMEEMEVQELVVGEEITLLNWGNFKVTGPAQLTSHLSGDPKTTRKRLPWLSEGGGLAVSSFEYRKLEMNMVPYCLDRDVTDLLKAGDYLQRYCGSYYVVQTGPDGDSFLNEVPTGREKDLF